MDIVTRMREQEQDDLFALEEEFEKGRFEMHDTHVTGTTESGAEVELYVEQDLGIAYVSLEADHIGYLRFNFNPDFPQDAKAFYEALVQVRSIILE